MELRENVLDIDTYLELRASVNWRTLHREQAEKALQNSMLTVVAYEEEKPVGMGRIVGDGAVICYVQDLVVRPDCQGKGVGGKVLQHLIAYVESLRMPETVMMLDLMCAKGREKFYKKHGFVARPTPDLGPGMIQYLQENKK